MSDYEVALDAKVCRACLESNLTETIKFNRCARCSERYCIHFASGIDAVYCSSCLAEVSLTKEVVVKTTEIYNEETDTIREIKRKAKSIKLGGMDWLFAARKIVTLTDDELEMAIEFHRIYLQGLLKEREERRIAKAHRYANTKFEVPKASAITSSTTVKKTKTISSTKSSANAAGILQAMQAAGMTPDKILAMLQAALPKKG